MHKNLNKLCKNVFFLKIMSIFVKMHNILEKMCIFIYFVFFLCYYLCRGDENGTN